MNPGLIKGYMAQGAIPPKRIVAFGAADETVKVAGSASDKILGVSDRMPTRSDTICDVILDDIGEVELGGPVTRGDRLTFKIPADGELATGLAIKGTSSTDTVGTALHSGVSGDIIPFLIERIPAVTPA